MCSIVLVTALSTALVQGPGEVARQRALVDSLLPQWQAAARAMMRADSLERARRQRRDLPVDTAMIGPFMVIAPDGEAAEHFRNFRAAVRERAAMLEGIPAELRRKLFVQRDGGGAWLRYQAERGDGTLVRIFGSSPRVRERFTRIAVDDAIYPYLPASLRTWVGSGQLGRGRQRAHVYREMATSQSAYARDCNRGEIPSCIIALGLDGRRTPSTLSDEARASFLMHALTTGGKAAIPRLQAAAEAEPAFVLQEASGVPLPQLVQSWRAGITRDYVSHAGLPRATLAALWWVAVALVFSLRSTRRRAE
jgi:hypothetical protein